jgi:GTP cyclohydrolase I
MMATKFSEEEDRLQSERNSAVDLDTIAQGVRLILEGLGEDPERAGLRETPRRVAEMFVELTAGMHEDPTAHVVPLPGDKHDEMVIVKDISIASLANIISLRLLGSVTSLTSEGGTHSRHFKACATS